MAGKRISREEIARRQLAIARLLAAKHAVSEIVEMLQASEEYASTSERTVWRDIKNIREQWEAEAREEIAGIKVTEQAELREIERLAALQYSVTKDPRFLTERLKAKARIAAMLGLDMPKKIAPTDPSGKDEYGIDALDRARRITSILETARARRDRQADTDEYLDPNAGETGGSAGEPGG